MTTEPESPQAFWEQRYLTRDRIWSGRPNPVLVDTVASLTPGAALDLGCGEGGDAIWLAEHGWHVTATDISQTALGRVASHAAERGVSERIRCERHDFAETFPAGQFALVSAQFLQSPITFPRAQVLQAATRAVAPGGLLLSVAHGQIPWAPPHHVALSPEAALAELALAPDTWEVLRAEEAGREATSPDGETVTVTDVVVSARRR